jgi:CubicO group peptidase (beta-lactamase class C family)
MCTTAGYLGEALNGKSWEEFTQLRILTPLGMTSTTFSVHESQQSSNFALPYGKVKDQIQLVSFYDRFQAVGPAESINSNLVDMTKWMLCLLYKGKYGETRIVSKAQLRQLVSPHIIAPAALNLYGKYPEIFD